MNTGFEKIGLALLSIVCCAVVARGTAHADLSACGQVDVRVRAECEIVPPSLECETRCTPVQVRTTCSARLAVACDGRCSEPPLPVCQASCEADCGVDCEAEPARFDCRADCRVACDGTCEADCASRPRASRASCRASCSGACSASCDRRCEIRPARVDCDAECRASCQGSCSVDRNVDCQVDCQADGYARCEADVTGGCRTACRGRRGALFCDGQFVDTGDRLDECVDALVDVLEAHVMASGSSSCTSSSCSTRGSARVACSVERVAGHAPSWALVALPLGLIAWRTRRRRT